MIKNYFKLGICHNLLFQGIMEDYSLHEKTLASLLELEEFEIIDISLPSDDKIRKKEVKMIEEAGKKIIYNFPLFFLDSINLDPNSGEVHVRKKTLDKAIEFLYFAAESGINLITFTSGVDKGFLERKKLKNNFINYSINFCEEAKKLGIKTLIEPFDRSFDKKFLIGPTVEAIEYIETLKKFGVENIGIMLDMAHMTLMDESFIKSVKVSAPYLSHVHIGNCIKKDSKNNFYGDKHPPLGIDGGENDLLELIEFFSALLNIGYIKKNGENSISLESKPYPGVSPKTSALVQFEKINSALEIMLKKCIY